MEPADTLNLESAGGHPFIRGIQRTILFHGMLAEKESVLVGVSGGPDSVALLCGLRALSPIYGWAIGVAHINHGLRAEASDAEARFVQDLAKCLNLSYYMERINLYELRTRKNINLEEAGRTARYEFFQKISAEAGFEKIAVGHQQKDAAEQVLLNLLRGAGPSGLGGIAPVKGNVIRPLIETSCEEIEQFLQDHEISFCTDQSNKDIQYTRNRIRNCLIPKLQTFNPRIVETLCRVSTLMREESEWIEEILSPVYEEAVILRKPENRGLELSAENVAMLQTAAKRRIIRRAIREVKGDLRRIEQKHIDAVVSITCEKAANGRQIHLPGKILAVRIGDRVGFTKEKKSLRSLYASGKKWETIPFEYKLERTEKKPELIWIEEIGTGFLFKPLSIHDIDQKFNPEEQAVCIDLERVDFPLVIRNPRPGDRFRPLGMYGTMKIKEFFINNKISREKRGRVPVIESGGKLICVACMRIDERVKITGATKKVLKISFLSTPTYL